MHLDGILNVNKPPACTSFSVVARLRRITGEKRVGHAGTLDPMATGVLVVYLGQATRIAEYILSLPKEYIAIIELGVSTDTYDGEGRVLTCKDAAAVTYSRLQEALAAFEGVVDQMPPAYSAVKVNGQPSYKYARAGVKCALQTRKVNIDHIEILEFSRPYLRILLQCSKGTYVRSLANDLGNLLGCGAYLKGLVRTAVGPFKISEAITPDRIQEYATGGTLNTLLIPFDYPLANWVKQILSSKKALSVSRGQDISLDFMEPEKIGCCRVYDPSDRFLAVMKYMPGTGMWHPVKVFNLT